MRFLNPISLPTLFSYSLTSIILVAVFTLNIISITNKFPYLMQIDHIHFAKALVSSKYPEVGLPSPKGPINT